MAIRLTDEPESFAEWLYRIKECEKTIFVRELVGNKYEVMALADLTSERWAFHVARWFEAGAIPVRIRSEEEIMGGNFKKL